MLVEFSLFARLVVDDCVDVVSTFDELDAEF